MSTTTEILQDAISKHITAIRRLFKPETNIHVTVVCRAPNDPNGGCLVGMDDEEDLIAEIRRRCDPNGDNEVLPARKP